MRQGLAFLLAAMSVAAVLLVGSLSAGPGTTTELTGTSLPVSYVNGIDSAVHSIDEEDYHGQHPSLHEAAFLEQLSGVLGSDAKKNSARPAARTQSLEDLDSKDNNEAEGATYQPHPLGDEVVELPIHNGEDMGDLHVPAEDIEAYNFAAFKSGHHRAVLREKKSSASGGWCHCDGKGSNCECSAGGNTELAGGRKVKKMSLMMNCCQCDGSQVNLPAGPCSDCYECGNKAYSPNYNPYGVRKEKAAGSVTPILRQQRNEWATRNGKDEPFWKAGEHKALPTDRMQTLNHIIQGARHFVRPPPTKDVYKVVQKTVVHKDPLVAAS